MIGRNTKEKNKVMILKFLKINDIKTGGKAIFISDIEKYITLERHTISKHLKELHAEKKVNKVKMGAYTLYSFRGINK